MDSHDKMNPPAKPSPPSATYDTFEQWWKANAYKFPQADYAANSYEEIARAAWEARAATLQNAAPQASSTQDSTRTGDDIGPSARHPTEKETGGAPAVAAPETTLSETAPTAEGFWNDKLPGGISAPSATRLLADKLNEADAARYRWLRHDSKNPQTEERKAQIVEVYQGDAMDEMIDKAMK